VLTARAPLLRARQKRPAWRREPCPTPEHPVNLSASGACMSLQPVVWARPACPVPARMHQCYMDLRLSAYVARRVLTGSPAPSVTTSTVFAPMAECSPTGILVLWHSLPASHEAQCVSGRSNAGDRCRRRSFAPQLSCMQTAPVHWVLQVNTGCGNRRTATSRSNHPSTTRGMGAKLTPICASLFR